MEVFVDLMERVQLAILKKRKVYGATVRNCHTASVLFHLYDGEFNSRFWTNFKTP